LGADPSRAEEKARSLAILWEEYIAQIPDGYRYSRFCDLYRSWEGRLSVTMRQRHAGGDKLFVDYAGDTVPVIVDRLSGETRPAQIFVAVMGASSFTYAKAAWTQGLCDWLSAHVGALEAIGGAPRLLVPDNAKVAVIKACHFDPVVNRSYAEMAAHYDMAVLPARPRKPKDKAKVEAAVLIVERWLLGRLRHRTFYSLAELNQAIAELLHHLNEVRPIRRLGVTRRQLLEELDRPFLRPLPAEPYVFAEWRARRVGIDYHVDIDHHFYSVPHRFARQPVGRGSPRGRWKSSSRASASPQRPTASVERATYHKARLIQINAALIRANFHAGGCEEFMKVHAIQAGSDRGPGAWPAATPATIRLGRFEKAHPIDPAQRAQHVKAGFPSRMERR
jgi:transposase